VERWPEWTTSVERIVALDGPGIEEGVDAAAARFVTLLRQP
jgi:hypothetical protein